MKEGLKVITIRLALAAFFGWYAVHELAALGEWEAHGGTYRMGSITHMLYGLGGKNLVVGIDVLLAVGFFVYAIVGIRQLIAARAQAA